MQVSDRDRIRGRCEDMGLAWAKATLPQFVGHVLHPYFAEWINETEARVAAHLEEKQHALAQRSVDAAETSATAALESARTSGTSARAAMFAAAVSFFALIVAIAAYFKQ